MAHCKPQNFWSSVKAYCCFLDFFGQNQCQHRQRCLLCPWALSCFHWTPLLVPPDTPSRDFNPSSAWRHCYSVPPYCSLALVREETVAMFNLASFRKVQIAWKARETRFWNVRLLFLNRLLIILLSLEVTKSRSGSLKKWTRGICCYLQTYLATCTWAGKCFKWSLGFNFRDPSTEYDIVHSKLKKITGVLPLKKQENINQLDAMLCRKWATVSYRLYTVLA